MARLNKHTAKIIRRWQHDRTPAGQMETAIVSALLTVASILAILITISAVITALILF